MPQYLSPEAQSLLRCLFKRNPANRLGSGPKKGQEVQDHEFFASIEFDKLLRKEVKPPYIPAPATADSQFHFSAAKPVTQRSSGKILNSMTKNFDYMLSYLFLSCCYIYLFVHLNFLIFLLMLQYLMSILFF